MFEMSTSINAVSASLEFTQIVSNDSLCLFACEFGCAGVMYKLDKKYTQKLTCYYTMIVDNLIVVTMLDTF